MAEALHAIAEERFGAETSARLAALLPSIDDAARVTEVHQWIVSSRTGDELIERVSREASMSSSERGGQSEQQRYEELAVTHRRGYERGYRKGLVEGHAEALRWLVQDRFGVNTAARFETLLLPSIDDKYLIAEIVEWLGAPRTGEEFIERLDQALPATNPNKTPAEPNP